MKQGTKPRGDIAEERGKRLARRLAVALALSGVLMSGCGDDPGDGAVHAITNARAKEAPEALRSAIQAASEEKGENRTQYVGKIDGTNAYLAVVDFGTKLVAYACDGAAIAQYLEGSRAGTGVSAKAEGAGGLEGQISGDTIRGTIDVAGTPRSFTVTKATLPAGFYELSTLENGQAVRARTVVLPDGTSRGTTKPYPCGEAEKQFETLMEIRRTSTGEVASEAGNDATSLFRAARKNGCSWTNIGSSPTS